MSPYVAIYSISSEDEACADSRYIKSDHYVYVLHNLCKEHLRPVHFLR
jgi:hypothetical protein